MAAIELKAYGKAGAVAEQAISSIHTVVSYNGQENETHRSVLECQSSMFMFSRQTNYSLINE